MNKPSLDPSWLFCHRFLCISYVFMSIQEISRIPMDFWGPRFGNELRRLPLRRYRSSTHSWVHSGVRGLETSCGVYHGDAALKETLTRFQLASSSDSSIMDFTLFHRIPCISFVFIGFEEISWIPMDFGGPRFGNELQRLPSRRCP